MSKAQILIERRMVVQDTDDPNFWEVKSLSQVGVRYIVYFKSTGGRCSCKGFQYRGTCSHLEAVRILADSRKEEKIPDGEVLL